MQIDIHKIIEAAQQGNKVLKKYFGQNLAIEEKSSPVDFRTIADLESEQNILDVLEKNFPSFSIHTEEKGFIDKQSPYIFYVDALDGTSNFVTGIPNFSLSIGLFEGRSMIAAVVSNPILDHIYYAQAGGGAFLNNQRITVSREKDMPRAAIAYDCDYGHYMEAYFRNLLKKLEQKKVKRLLVNMSPALDFCRLASGKIEAVINNGNEIYDFAGGKLIAREAGGLITDFSGKKEEDERNNVFLASNGTALHRKILDIV